MGNKPAAPTQPKRSANRLGRANVPPAATDISDTISQSSHHPNGQPLSIFNCMAVTNYCCVKDEVRTGSVMEVDVTRKWNSIQDDSVKGKRSKRATSPVLDDQTHNTENVASDLDFDDEEFTLSQKKLKNERLFSQPNISKLTESDANDLQPSKRGGVRKPPGWQTVKKATAAIGGNARNKAIQLMDARSQMCFNNRNRRVMTSIYAQDSMATMKNHSYDMKAVQTARQFRTNDELFVENKDRIQRFSVGDENFDTPSTKSPVDKEGPVRKQHTQAPAKLCLTEVEQSEGDHAPPDEEDPEHQGERNFSPDVRDLPNDLDNLEKMSDNGDDIEVMSIHSQRLYTVSQERYQANKRSKVMKNTRKQRLLFPELSKIQPVYKEQSKQKIEFKRQMQQGPSTLRASFRKRDKSSTSSLRKSREVGRYASAKLPNKLDGLPSNIKLFLEQAKGKFPTVTTQSGAMYVGEMVQQKQNGFGFCLAADDSYYFGDWLQGKRNGTGRQVLADGTKYEGNWLDDKMNGQGTCQNANGTVYEGEWKDHQPHGRGTETFPDNSNYHGQFAYGKKNGFGQLVCPDGGIYKGQFVNNLINGKGVYTWPDGIQYQGMWVNNKKHGKGQLKWLDGSREYNGEFKEDERHGEGTYTWEFGTKSYRGFWRNGLKDGIGYVRDEFDYVERKGLWFCGKLVKWMPREDEDEGQEGESVVSQDIIDWEGHQSNAQDHKIQSVQASPAHEREDRPTPVRCEDLKEAIQAFNFNEETKNPIDQNQHAGKIQIEVSDQDKFEEQQSRNTRRNVSLQLPINQIKRSTSAQHSLTQSITAGSLSTKRQIPTYRKAVDEVKRVKVNRKQIKKRLGPGEVPQKLPPPPVIMRQASHVPTQSQGMLSRDQKIQLVAGNDLDKFNPPEVWEEMVKQYANSNELPSPTFVNKDVDVDAETDQELEQEYFQFDPEGVDDDDEQ